MTDLAAAFDAHALRVVKAVADHGSLTAAAASLGYSQPALSQLLKRLEARIGVPLVERVGRRMRLTEAGEVLARHAPAVTSALDAAAGELDELRGLRTGRVRLAAFPSASATLVPRLLAELARTHPGIALTYVEAEPPEAVDAVRAGRADVAVTFSYPGDRDDPHGESALGLAVREIGRDELRAVLPAGHPAAVSGSVDLAELADADWIAGCPRCRGHLLEACAAAGFTPRIGFETDNFVAVQNLVAMGLGVALLPRMALDSTPAREGIVARPTLSGDARTVHLVTARGARNVPATAVVLASLERLAV